MRERLLWFRMTVLLLLGLTWLAPWTAFAQNPNTPIENKDYFVSDTGDDDTTVLVRVARGINLNTEAFATRFRVTPFDIRRENPRATLALCKNAKGRFQMSKEVVSVATRESETIWKDCPADRRYTYIVPGSTLLITIGKHRATYEQEQQSLEALKACPQVATASCVSKALEPLGKTFDGSPASSAPPSAPQVVVQKPSLPVTVPSPQPSPQPMSGGGEKAGSDVPFIGMFLIAMLAFLIASALWRVSADKAARLRATLNAAKEQAAARESELEALLEKHIAASKEDATNAATKHAADMNEMQVKFNTALRLSKETSERERLSHRSALEQLEVKLGIEKQSALSALTAELRRQFDLEKSEAVEAARQSAMLSEPVFIELHKDIDASRARIQDLEKQNTQLIHESGVREDRLREVQMLLDAAQEELAEQQRAVEERRELQKLYEDLTSQIKDLPDQLAAHSQRQAEIEAEIDGLGEDMTRLAPLQDELNGLLAEIQDKTELLNGARTQAAGVLERLRQSYIDTTGVSHFPPPITA